MTDRENVYKSLAEDLLKFQRTFCLECEELLHEKKYDQLFLLIEKAHRVTKDIPEKAMKKPENYFWYLEGVLKHSIVSMRNRATKQAEKERFSLSMKKIAKNVKVSRILKILSLLWEYDMMTIDGITQFTGINEKEAKECLKQLIEMKCVKAMSWDTITYYGLTPNGYRYLEERYVYF